MHAGSQVEKPVVPLWFSLAMQEINDYYETLAVKETKETKEKQRSGLARRRLERDERLAEGARIAAARKAHECAVAYCRRRLAMIDTLEV